MTDRIFDAQSDADAILQHMQASSSPSLRIVDLIQALQINRVRVHAGLGVLVRDRTVVRYTDGARYALRERSSRARAGA